MLSVQHLNKTYRTSEVPFQALHDIQCSIERGEFTAIVGPSGSGKTTLLNCIGCIDSWDSGDVVLNGESLSQKDERELTMVRRRHYGFVFQTYNLIPVMTVYENVELPLRLLKSVDKSKMRDMVMTILDNVGLSGLDGRYPSELSGGQQQRVSVARALVKRPLLVLADEPTANLDSQTGESIIRLMKDLNEDFEVTFLFCTHDERVMKQADRIITLEDGRIRED
ncbi:MAG: ABC transporter ATP-binding protein [Spirochaetota bacterium]